MAKLVHSRDGQFLEDISLKEGSWLIGRHPECGIRVNDGTVSGKHAKITVSPSGCMEGLLNVHIEDQGSTNGTRVNGKVIKLHLLKHNEAAKIGSHEFVLVNEASRDFKAAG